MLRSFLMALLMSVPTGSAVAQDDIDWGPMAVVHDTAREGLDAGLGPGTLVMSDACVTIEGDRGAGTTLVWRDWQAAWDSDRRTVVFVEDGRRLKLRPGDRLAFGGYAPWVPGGGGPPAPPWLAEPNPDCPEDLFLVHSVSRVGPDRLPSSDVAPDEPARRDAPADKGPRRRSPDRQSVERTCVGDHRTEPAAPTGGPGAALTADAQPTWSVILGAEGVDCSIVDLQQWGSALVGVHGRWLWRSFDDGATWQLRPLPGGPDIENRRLLVADEALTVFGVKNDRLLGWRTTDSDDLSEWTRVKLPKPPRRWARTIDAIQSLVRLDTGRMVVAAATRGDPPEFTCESRRCSDRSTVWASDDGIEWTVGQPLDAAGEPIRDRSGNRLTLDEVVSAPGRFLAPGPDGAMLASADGIAWSDAGIGPGQSGLQYAWSTLGGYLLAAGTKDVANGIAFVVRSSDLRTWELVREIADPDFVISDVGSGPAGDLVTGRDGARERAWMLTTTDGVTWTTWDPTLDLPCGGEALVSTDAFYAASTCEGPAVVRADAPSVWRAR